VDLLVRCHRTVGIGLKHLPLRLGYSRPAASSSRSQGMTSSSIVSSDVVAS
jgi:hypothetical protein